MNRVIAFLISAMFSVSALAASPASKASDAKNAPGVSPETRRDMTRECNAQAKGMKRSERKAFMKTCMAGNPNVTAAPQTQADKAKPALEAPKP